VLEDQPLDTSLHDRADFDCGVPALNEYLRQFADQHRRKGITNIYVLADSAYPSTVVGYYTLSAAEVDVARLPDADRKRLPRFPVPCFRMGRLACRIDRQGEGLGKLLLGCAVDRCLAARKQVAAYALLVDAKDEPAKSFYGRFGFTALRDAELTLYLPLGP
jgi:GNAT superfamily N-acetyltransferase